MLRQHGGVTSEVLNVDMAVSTAKCTSCLGYMAYRQFAIRRGERQILEVSKGSVDLCGLYQHFIDCKELQVSGLHVTICLCCALSTV